MVEKLNVSDFDGMFSIMEKSFPEDERRPYSEQKELLKNEYYNVYVEKENGSVIGFISVWGFPEFLYIEHFAVAPDYRNRGIGEKLVNYVSSLYDKTICLEVEPPEDEFAKRRIGFYERNGFFLNEYPYMQPPISKGKNPIPLMIMSKNDRLCKEKFTEVKSVLYTKVYKCEISAY